MHGSGSEQGAKGYGRTAYSGCWNGWNGSGMKGGEFVVLK